MRKARHVLLAAILLAGIAAAGCSDSRSGNPSQGAAEAAVAFTPGKPIRASFSDPRVEGMKGVAENERLRLFADDQTGAIAVLHKQSGEIWYSNPPDRDSDPLAAGVNKDLLSAQLKIDFYNHFGQLNSIDSYTDSVVHKQIKAEPIPSGVRVTYQFGKAEKSADDLPVKLSKARFEELSGKLDNTGKRALTIAYKEDAEQSVYERNDSALQGLQLERAIKALEDAGYTEEDRKKDMAELHLDQTKPEPRIFLASIEYTLDAGSLVATVPASGIHYPSDYPVYSISLLSYFGAEGKGTKGSLFVPDGSGALIHYHNGKTEYPAYQQPVYGSDLTIERTEDAAREETVRLPVFGSIREGAAFLGIIEEGAPAAVIHADVGGRLNSYNYVYPSFYVIRKDQVTLDANGQQRSVPKFQEDPMKTDFTVRYAFLTGTDASHAGMAKFYRQYLIDRGGLPGPNADRGREQDVPFYLQLIGSIDKKKRAIGIPYRALEPLTTFDQAQTIVTQALQRDIRNIRLQYAGWFNGGLNHRVPNRVSVDEAIGGSRGLIDFVSFARDKGIGFYPDASILTVHTGKGFKESKDASRTLRSVPAELYPLDLALNRRDRSRSPSYVASPRLVSGYADALLKGLGRYRSEAISLRDLADQLNSDFRKRKQIDRTESERISIEALRKMQDEGLKIMGNGGNAYALPYLTDITNAPMSGSRFKLEDEEIPFYQMVVRGFIDYTGAPYNLSAYTDVRQYVLKCLEYGSGVYFAWIYEPNHRVKDSDFNDLYAVHYAQWLDQAADVYREVNGVLRNVRNEPIVAHEKLREGAFRTVYGNGAYIIVNYNRFPIQVDGKRIEAESYATGGEAS
ncbi:hypothetical protein GE107_04125 [Cohnella sp. CFH 77786]|uniref:DUF5696 domain-containing protein n=1 Tax=Cohnella sp. CFH 77786 TaxID=2662265 RepID=UPI001C60B84D|nr:DUF5696 domain-containing protein [Cohnella sp. CFH 77786]MBW5445250.1 hypothetical protein [Cohnella sp. CFH 77786]